MTKQSDLTKLVEQGQLRYGDKFDGSDLEAAAHFAPYCGKRDIRIKVRSTFGEEIYERTGTVGITTGWKPAFLLIHRSNDTGSSDVLGPNDKIVGFWNGRRYE